MNEMPIKRHGWTFAQIPIELITDENVSDSDVRVFAYFLYRQGDDEETFVGVDRAAKDLHMGNRSVLRSLANLSKANWLRRQKRFGHSSLTHLFASRKLCLDFSERLCECAKNGTSNVPKMAHHTDSQYTDIKDSIPPQTPPSTPTVEKPLTPQQAMIKKLAEIMRLDDHLAAKRLAKFAAALIKAKYTIDDLERVYGVNGAWWRKDWRGLKGQSPTEPDIRSTLKALLADDKPKEIVLR